MAGRVRTAAVWTKSGKLMIIQSGSRRTKASQEAWQKALNALHLEKCVFLVQVMLLRDKMFVNVAHMERC
uniref:Zinc finger protein 268 n=1 Tax=Sciurus vulgaris TaxID=55149 RepID=A0A8D2CWQ0_SCIVU